MALDVEVQDNPAAHRYEITLDGQLAGFAVYYQDGDRRVFVHTEIADSAEGHGLGTILAKSALDDVRRRHLGLVPLCPFIAAFVRKHPEYRDLVRPLHGRTVLAGDGA